MTQRPRRRSVLVCCVTVATLVATLGACGNDDDSAVETTTPSGGPAASFEGTYTVFQTTATVDRQPVTGADADPASSTWIVQSSCSDANSQCVAVARSTRPDTSSGLNLDRMEFVLDNGSWSRVAVPPARPCVPQGVSAPVDEPWVAIDSATLTPRGTSPDGPAFTLSGPTTSIQGGSCSRVTDGRITLTRKGDLPANTSPLDDVSVPEKVASPQGAGFRGSYRQQTTVASWDPPSLISRPTVQNTEISATSTCTRDGEKCVAVMVDKPSGPGQTVVSYSDGGFAQTATLPERQCPGRPDRYRPTVTSRTRIPAGSSAPIAAMTSESALTWSGVCAGTVRFTSTLTRTGD